jgi:hypothetical protein
MCTMPKIAHIVDRVMQSIDNNPELVTRLVLPVEDGYSDKCSSTCLTHRSLTFGATSFGMARVLPTS